MAESTPGPGTPNNPLAVHIQSFEGIDFREDWHNLVRGLEDHNDKLDKLTEAIKDSLKDTSKRPPQGRSDAHSLGEQWEPTQSGEGGASRPPGQEEKEELGGINQYAEYLNQGPLARRFAKRPLQGDDIPTYAGDSTSGRSLGASVPGAGPSGEQIFNDPITRMNQALPDERSINPLLYGGQFTAQNALYAIGGRLGGMFSNQWNEYQKKDWDPALQPSPGLRTAAEAMGRAGQQWPNVLMARQYLQRAGGFAQQTQDYGELLGTSSGTAASVGGFRIPFTGAGFRGLEQGVSDKIKGIFEGGISGSQIGEIRSGLAGAGWTPETARTSGLQSGFEHTFQSDQGVAKSVLQSGLWDKALREGATSTDNFFRSIKGLRDVANTAKVSVDELVQSMDEYGQANQGIGGTHFQGQQLASTIGNQGFAPSEFQGLMFNNPWTDASVFRQSGVTPWTQGAMNPSQRLTMALGGFKQAANMFPATPQTTTIAGAKDMQTGKDITSTIPGTAYQAAQMSLIPGMDQIPVELRRKLIENPGMLKGIQQGLSISQSTDFWTGQIVQHGNTKLLGNNVKGGFDWGDLQHQLKTASTYNPDTKQVERIFTGDDLKKLQNPVGGVEIAKWKASGLGDQDIAKKVAQARSGEIHEILDKKMAASNDAVQAGDVTIELGPAAKKAFHLNTSPQGQAKLNALAGGGRTNTPYGSGPSTIPSFGDGYIGG